MPPAEDEFFDSSANQIWVSIVSCLGFLVFALLLARRWHSHAGPKKREGPATINDVLTAHRHSMVANSILEVAADGSKKVKVQQQQKTNNSTSLGCTLPRRATINTAGGAGSLEVVASSQSAYFEAMDGDVLEEHVLVYEGAGVYAIPLDTEWSDADHNDDRTTLQLFEPPYDQASAGGSDEFSDAISSLMLAGASIDHTEGTADVLTDFAESEQMVNTRFAAMGRQEPNGSEYLDVLGNRSSVDDDEYLDVVGDGGGGGGGEEYLEVDGNDDNDFMSVLKALKSTPAVDFDADADEYLEVAAESESEPDPEEDDSERDAFSKPGPGRLKNVWAPAGAIRAPKMVFKKGSAWKSTATKLAAVNAFKRPPPLPKRYGNSESVVDDAENDEEPPPLLPRLLPKPALPASANAQPTSSFFEGMLDGLTMAPVVPPAPTVRQEDISARYRPTGLVRAPSFVIRRLPQSKAAENADEEL